MYVSYHAADFFVYYGQLIIYSFHIAFLREFQEVPTFIYMRTAQHDTYLHTLLLLSQTQGCINKEMADIATHLPIIYF